MTQPDPDPYLTTGLEPGGGVPPGETPPAEASTSGISHREEAPAPGITAIALIAIGVLVVLVLLFVLGRVLDLL
jgi:hypothetical protein